MTDRTNTEQKLAGQRVAFTGRLALMPRRTAVGLVELHGGTITPTVNSQTTLLVVGREGWPLRSDGRPTRKLVQARRLVRKKQALEVVPEERFFALLGLNQHNDSVRRGYSIAELTEL